MNLKARIKEAGWTMERLAREMKNRNGEKGISQPSMSSIINGNPTLDKLQEIASIVGISLSELVADSPGAASGVTAVCPHCGKPVKVNVSLGGQ